MRQMKIIITNLPSFYKIRLFNEINKQLPLYVLFTGHGPEVRNEDFFKGNIEFQYANLNRNFILNLHNIINLLRINYKEIILCGWDNIYMWIPLLFSKKNS